MIRTAIAACILLSACGPGGPPESVRAAACDYVQRLSSGSDFARREIEAAQSAAGGDYDEFVAIGPERQERYRAFLQDVRTIGAYDPMGASAASSAQTLEAFIAADEAFVSAPGEERFRVMGAAFDAFRVQEAAFLSDLREHVPQPCE